MQAVVGWGVVTFCLDIEARRACKDCQVFELEKLDKDARYVTDKKQVTRK